MRYAVAGRLHYSNNNDMGCSSSAPARVAPPEASVPLEGPLSNTATAERLSAALEVSKAAMLEALPGLQRCFQARLPGRSIYKAIDLAILTTMVVGSDGTKHGGVGFNDPGGHGGEEVGLLLREGRLCE